jgi:hypothetical protein
MAIEFQCVHCNRELKLKDKCAGLRGECPYCKGVITVPSAASAEKPQETEEPEFTPPTKKQLDYARKLGVSIPKGISRGALSLMIDEAKDNAPATEKQKEFLRELGVKFPDGIRVNQASLLIDGAMNIRDEISSALQKQLEEQWKAAGQLMEHASVDQLLQEIDNRGKPFVAFIMEDDEFHYQEKLPMRGRLVWNAYLSPDDVKYLIASFAIGWAKSLDMDKYTDEYDGTPPELKFLVGELVVDADNVVNLSTAFDDKWDD